MTGALVAAITSTFIRLQVGGQLPERRLLAGAFSARSLANGDFSRLLTSTLLTRDIFMTISIVLSLLVTVGAYEVIAGHLRVGVVAVITAVAGPVGVAAGLGALSAAGIGWASGPMATVDIGASAMVAGASGALAIAIGQRRVTAALALFILGGLLMHHQLADWEHLVAFPVGMLLARLLGPRPVRTRNQRRINLYAITAAITASAAVLAMLWILPDDRTTRDASGHTLSPPRLIDTNYPTPALGGTRRVVIVLPPGYDNSTRRYPVVELLHGNPGRPEDLLTVGNIQQSASPAGVQPFIAVIPDGSGPHVANGWYTNIPSQQLGTAVGTDLRQWTDQTLRVTDSWSYAGLSAGGYGAAYLAMTDPQPVHAVCGLSGYYTANIPPLLGASTCVAFAQRPKSEPEQRTSFDLPRLRHLGHNVRPRLRRLHGRTTRDQSNRHPAALCRRPPMGCLGPGVRRLLPGNPARPVRAHRRTPLERTMQRRSAPSVARPLPPNTASRRVDAPRSPGQADRAE